MTFGPEKGFPNPHGTIEEKNPEDREGRMEAVKIPHKALLAVIAGLLWLEYKGLGHLEPLGPTFPGQELSPEDKKKVEKQGWLKTAFGKAQKVYELLGKVEQMDSLEDIFRNNPNKKQALTS